MSRTRRNQDAAYLERAERLLLELLAVPGRSGHEARILETIAGHLRAAGAPSSWLRFDDAHRRSRHGGEVGNLICRLPGDCAGPRRLLMAHVDTVPLCEGAVPVRRGRWLVPADPSTGLGADDRAGAAAVLATATEILRRRLPHPPLVFVWTVQEEVGLYGARHLCLGLLGRPRLAFNFDGGSPEKITIGATGGYRMEIRVRGRAAHAGNAPEQGVNAATVAGLAIARLHAEGWLGLIEKPDGRGTSNLGVVHGGEATNVVMPLIELRAEARSHDPRFRRKIVEAYRRAFRDAACEVVSAAGRRAKIEFQGRLDYEAFRLADDEPCVVAAEQAVRAAGGSPRRAVSNGGLDANWLSARGIPTVSLGCGQLHPHTTAERLELRGFRLACRVALRLAAPRLESS